MLVNIRTKCQFAEKILAKDPIQFPVTKRAVDNLRQDIAVTLLLKSGKPKNFLIHKFVVVGVMQC